MRFLISLRHRGVFRLRHGDADDLAAGLFEPMDLGDGRLDVVGVGRGHRLHPDRVVAADDEVADADLAGLVPGEWVLIGHWRFVSWRAMAVRAFGRVILSVRAGGRQDGTSYQILVRPYEATIASALTSAIPSARALAKIKRSKGS